MNRHATSAALNCRLHWTCHCRCSYRHPPNRTDCSRRRSCCNHRSDHSAHCRPGKPLRRSMNDGLGLGLCNEPCVNPSAGTCRSRGCLWTESVHFGRGSVAQFFGFGRFPALGRQHLSCGRKAPSRAWRRRPGQPSRLRVGPHADCVLSYRSPLSQRNCCSSVCAAKI